MRRRTLDQLNSDVEVFNANHPVGSEVMLRLDDGKLFPTRVLARAYVMGGHSAVAFFYDIVGCYEISRVE